MIELLILYILNRYDATIYKIQKLIEEVFFAYSKPSLGTINPALKRLEGMSCVEFEKKMTDGGKLSKIYRITPFGVKYLKNVLVAFEYKNQGYLLNYVALSLCLSDVLDDDEKKEFYKNLHNHLAMYKIDVQKTLDNPYILHSDIQKHAIKSTLKSTDVLIDTILTVEKK